MPQQRLSQLVLVATTLLLAGCGGEVPGFLGREGSDSSSFSAAGPDLPDPVPVPARSITVEPALNGTILRVDVVAPTQGYHSARLVSQGDGRPDESGTLGLALTAVPPAGAEGIGPERTRTLRAAIFVPNRAKRQVKSIRILDAGGMRTVSLR